jgi:hypothetical protein
MAKTTAATSVESFAAGLSGKALHCRELGHNWRPLAAQWDGQAGAYDRRLRCPSCGTQRVQVITRDGHVLTNRYVYPEGYLLRPGTETGGVSALRDVLRLESLTRWLDQAPQVPKQTRKGRRGNGANNHAGVRPAPAGR